MHKERYCRSNAHTWNSRRQPGLSTLLWTIQAVPCTLTAVCYIIGRLTVAVCHAACWVCAALCRVMVQRYICWMHTTPTILLLVRMISTNITKKQVGHAGVQQHFSSHGQQQEHVTHRDGECGASGSSPRCQQPQGQATAVRAHEPLFTGFLPFSIPPNLIA